MPTIKNHPTMDKLGKAISEGDLPSVKLICQNLPKGFNINTVFEHFLSGVGKGRKGKGHTLLTFAFQKHQNVIAKHLIDHCAANVTVAGKFGSPLMTAIKVLNKEGVAILLQKDEIKSELLSCNKSSSALYQLQKMYGNETDVAQQKNIISLSKDMIKHGANRACPEADDFLKKILRPAKTITPIDDLTSMSPTAAQQSLERSSRELLDPMGNGITGGNSTLMPSRNGSSPAFPNHSIQNATVNGTIGVNSTLIPGGKGSYAILPKHSILSYTGNDTIGVNRSDIPEVICSSDGIGSLISGIVGVVFGAGMVTGAHFIIKRYKENKNYIKALEMTTNNSSNSSTPLA